MLTDKVNCNITINILEQLGVCEAVCSPGSRNAPLLLALEHSKKIRKHVVIDERSAGFIALGLAQTGKSPVILTCTSGTAMLNYAPAIAEAFYQGLPLIVLTADRPYYIIDQDDSQTIRQPGSFNHFVKKSFDILDFEESNSAEKNFCVRSVNDAYIIATSGKKGPVHINLQLGDPLTRSTSGERVELSRIIECLHADDIISKDIVKHLAERICSSRILVVAGFMQSDDRLGKAMQRFSQLPNVYVMSETLANLHIRKREIGIDTLLSSLSAAGKKAMEPDIVITLGGALVSRKLKEWLRGCSRIEHWMLGHSHATVDCFNALTKRIEANPGRFISMLGKFMVRVGSQGDYRKKWRAVELRASLAHRRIIDETEWSSLAAYSWIFSHMDQRCNVQISNGTSVRYAQLCTGKMPHGCWCNRGVSGIEGSLSTAIGASLDYPETTLLLIGDMSIAYDIGALSTNFLPERLKIVVLSNGGGEIFRFIPTTRDLEEREQYFSVPPVLPLQGLCKAYGLNYYRADSMASLQTQWAMFMSPGLTSSVLELRVPDVKSAEILENYFKKIYEYVQLEDN